MPLGLQATAVQDPSTEAAKFLKALGFGGLDPSTTALMAGEAFGSQFTSPMAGALIGERVQRAGLEAALNQGGTGVGPAGDLVRALQEAQLGMQRVAARPRLGGGGGDLPGQPVPVEPPRGPPIVLPPTRGTGGKLTAVKNPQGPVKPEPDALRAIRDALRLSETFAREQGTFKQRAETLPSFAGAAGQDALEQHIFGGGAQREAHQKRFAGMQTPGQVFWAALNDPQAFPELRQGGIGKDRNMARMTDAQIGREALRAYHGGDQARTKEALTRMQQQRSFGFNAGTPAMRQAATADEAKTFDRLASRADVGRHLDIDFGKMGVSAATFLRSVLSPNGAREMLAFVESGGDVGSVLAGLKANFLTSVAPQGAAA